MNNEGYALLEKIAKSMNCKIATFKDINECIENDISFGFFVDTDSYITEEEREKLKWKSYMGK